MIKLQSSLPKIFGIWLKGPKHYLVFTLLGFLNSFSILTLVLFGSCNFNCLVSFVNKRLEAIQLQMPQEYKQLGLLHIILNITLAREIIHSFNKWAP
jgi:hypothetical protein